MSKSLALKGPVNGAFSRWALGVLAAGTIAATSFAWGEITAIGKDVAAIKADMAHVKEALTALSADRYYRREAEKDLHAMGQRIDILERRLERAEGSPAVPR